MARQRRFMKEFRAAAVRLVQTSGRTQRAVAEDLGIGLSTLVRWIGRSRDRRSGDPCGSEQADVVAGLKRLQSRRPPAMSAASTTLSGAIQRSIS